MGADTLRDEVLSFWFLFQCVEYYFSDCKKRKHHRAVTHVGYRAPERPVSHSTGQIKHTDPRNALCFSIMSEKTQDSAHYLFVQANKGQTTMVTFFSTVYHASL